MERFSQILMANLPRFACIVVRWAEIMLTFTSRICKEIGVSDFLLLVLLEGVVALM